VAFFFRKNRMRFSESLKKNQQFRAVYEKGTSCASRYLVVYKLENGLKRNRLGISVSKKVGNSVVRHHLARLIRENYRLSECIKKVTTLSLLPELLQKKRIITLLEKISVSYQRNWIY